MSLTQESKQLTPDQVLELLKKKNDGSASDHELALLFVSLGESESRALFMVDIIRGRSTGDVEIVSEDSHPAAD